MLYKKEYLCQQAGKSYLLHEDVFFTDQNIMQSGNTMELNFEGLQMQKWNILSDRAQRVHDKNRVICLVFMFTPRVI